MLLAHTQHPCQAFTDRLYPTTRQPRLLERPLDECRSRYHHLLAERRDAWEQRQESARLARRTGAPTPARAQSGAAEPSERAVAGVAATPPCASTGIDLAFQAFVRRVKAGAAAPGDPRFRGWGRDERLTCPQAPVGAVGWTPTPQVGV
jgi:hypothetical protein